MAPAVNFASGLFLRASRSSKSTQDAKVASEKLVLASTNTGARNAASESVLPAPSMISIKGRRRPARAGSREEDNTSPRVSRCGRAELNAAAAR
ncbi:MAG: hypothetical protein GWO24_31450 [Akkermansiaceae bacterium]|nr:hypothetical protein [Akkermansiaceae bacterium]